MKKFITLKINDSNEYVVNISSIKCLEAIANAVYDLQFENGTILCLTKQQYDEIKKILEYDDEKN